MITRVLVCNRNTYHQPYRLLLHPTIHTASAVEVSKRMQTTAKGDYEIFPIAYLSVI